MLTIERIEKEYKSHGVSLVRIHYQIPHIAELSRCNEFYERLRDAMLDYAERLASHRAEKLASAARSERAKWSGITLSLRVTETFSDERLFSLYFDFMAEDREGILRFCRVGQIISRESGLFLSPTRFTSERLPHGGRNAYLTDRDVVVPERRSSSEEKPISRLRRAALWVKESTFPRQ